ncbi:hypothetical protein ACD661_12745 [Legionella lytica]|uniref:Uncharacterized protein n=1 Tax=Legionella lytica TaxID=96232 RepID=A0ABW8D9Q8_9GAMM
MLTKFVKKSKLVALLNTFNADDIPLDSGSLEQLLDEYSPPYSHKQNLMRLVNAVKQGDINNPAFRDEKAEFYLIYLYLSHQFLTHQIPPEHAHADLSGLMQTLERQQQSNEDIPALNKEEFLQSYLYLLGKKDYQQELVVLKADENDLALITYAEKLSKNYPNVSEAYILQKIRELTGINKLFLLVPKKPESDALLEEALIHPAGLTEPLSTPAAEISYQERAWILIPPIELVTWLANQCTPEHQIEMEPCLGVIGTETLYRDFHLNNKRPVTLASRNVSKNLTMAHNLSSTTLGILAHDIYFHFMALALLPPNGFRLITEVILAELKQMKEYEPGIPQAEQSKNINDLIEFLNDFAAVSDTKTRESQPLEQIAAYVLTAMVRNNTNFFIFLKIAQSLTVNNEQLSKQYNVNINSLINLIYGEQAELIPKLIACGSAYAQKVYEGVIQLHQKKLLTSVNTELLFAHKEYATQLTTVLIALEHYSVAPVHLLQIAQSGMCANKLTEVYKTLSSEKRDSIAQLITKYIVLPIREDVQTVSSSSLEALLMLQEHPVLLHNSTILERVMAGGIHANHMAECVIVLYNQGISIDENMLDIIERNKGRSFSTTTLLFLCNHAELSSNPYFFDYLLGQGKQIAYIVQILNAQQPKDLQAFSEETDFAIGCAASALPVQGSLESIKAKFNLIGSDSTKEAITSAAAHPEQTARGLATVLYANYTLAPDTPYPNIQAYIEDHKILSDSSFTAFFAMLFAHDIHLSHQAIEILNNKPLEQRNLINLIVCISKFISLNPQLLDEKAIEHLCSLPSTPSLLNQPTMVIYTTCKKLDDLIKLSTNSTSNTLFAGTKLPSNSVQLTQELMTSLCHGAPISPENWQQLEKIDAVKKIMEPIANKFPNLIPEITSSSMQLGE